MSPYYTIKFSNNTKLIERGKNPVYKQIITQISGRKEIIFKNILKPQQFTKRNIKL